MGSPIGIDSILQKEVDESRVAPYDSISEDRATKPVTGAKIGSSLGEGGKHFLVATPCRQVQCRPASPLFRPLNVGAVHKQTHNDPNMALPHR